MHMLRINFGSAVSVFDSVVNTLSRLSYLWPFSWRSVSALVLGIFLANWFWVLFAPNATYTAAIPERTAELEAGKLFGVIAKAESTATGGEMPNVKLLGVFTASTGRAGFAVLKVDDKRQAGVAEGMDVVSGTKLISVHADHVMLERGGTRHKVKLENKYAGSSNKLTVPAHGAAAAVTTGNKQVDSVMNSKGVQERLQQMRR